MGGWVQEPATQKTILVVDDEDGVRESVREVLSDEGYRVVDTADGTQVLRIIKEQRPELVLLDIWMPQMDGIGLLKEIKSQKPDINVVMVSGHGNIHTAVTATKFGAFDFIEKPVSLDGLLSTVQRALGQAPVPGGGTQTGMRSRKVRAGKPATVKTAAARQRLKQKTLAKSVVLSGQGLHSGVKTGLILHPLPANSGILFTGISGDVTVPAHLDYVGSTGYATSLRSKDYAVGTVEHLLAVLHSYGISNLLIKVQGEIPILDGSALEFCEAIDETGVEEQDEEAAAIVIDREYRLDAKDGQSIGIEPAESFSVRYVLRYPQPVGEQEHLYVFRGPQFFKAEIAPARTFGFLKDIAQLQNMGLANGGRLSNFILIDDEKIVNTRLRFENEFARHKILDILGDFYLLGRPILGALTAIMTGHSDNIALLRKVREGMEL
ncbi:MAG TPA: UDP-3-O-acyl-N-acetylglucosamine deacetylase [Phototrophicaceae bacterium]|jgi:UDP-3-O-acyl N-acetylglucosamine deacetylase|nr:UDP-3-O-acyl-N-acetylglucosamine deacetylase [Phototrophicaceae bacterium]